LKILYKAITTKTVTLCGNPLREKTTNDTIFDNVTTKEKKILVKGFNMSSADRH